MVGIGWSVQPRSGTAAQRRGDLPQARQHVVVQPGDLRHDDVRILAVLGETFHHGAEEGLREAGRAVERFFDRQLAGALSAFDLRPQFVEEHARLPVEGDCVLQEESHAASRIRVGSDTDRTGSMIIRQATRRTSPVHSANLRLRRIVGPHHDDHVFCLTRLSTVFFDVSSFRC